MWAVRIASHPHYDKEGQESNVKAIQQLGDMVGGKRRKSSFDFADSDETRLRMIGGELVSRGDKWDEWVIKHPRQMQWLKHSGKTLDDARQAFDSWWEESIRDDDEFEDGIGGEVSGGIGSGAGEANAAQPGERGNQSPCQPRSA